MNKLILYVCAWICLHSCGFSKSQEESMLEYALSQAGDNRKELEYVIKYYEGYPYDKFLRYKSEITGISRVFCLISGHEVIVALEPVLSYLFVSYINFTIFPR